MQEAVFFPKYNRTETESVKQDSKPINNGNIYKWIATGDPTYDTTDITLVSGSELVKMDKNNHKLTINLPEYSGQDWYIDIATGKVYLLPDGYIYEGKAYKTQSDIASGGTE